MTPQEENNLRMLLRETEGCDSHFLKDFPTRGVTRGGPKDRSVKQREEFKC